NWEAERPPALRPRLRTSDNLDTARCPVQTCRRLGKRTQSGSDDQGLVIAGDGVKFSRMTTRNENRWTRRDFLGTVAAASAAVSFPTVLRGAVTKTGSRKPNVLFLMSDDMRVELGCYGSMFQAKTPNLDALAKSGVRFDRNYCQFPLCNPSRASLLTGRNPTRTSVLGNRTDFRVAHPDWTTLPQLFGENGYVTMRAGKIYHGGIDDAKSWNASSEKDHPTDDGGGPQTGHTMEIPRA